MNKNRVRLWNPDTDDDLELWVCSACGAELHSDCVGDVCPCCGAEHSGEEGSMKQEPLADYYGVTVPAKDEDGMWVEKRAEPKK